MPIGTTTGITYFNILVCCGAVVVVVVVVIDFGPPATDVVGPAQVQANQAQRPRQKGLNSGKQGAPTVQRGPIHPGGPPTCITPSRCAQFGLMVGARGVMG